MLTLIEFILNYWLIIILIAILLRKILKYTSIWLIIISLLFLIIYYTIWFDNEFVIIAILWLIDTFKIDLLNIILILLLILVWIDFYIFAYQRSNIYNDKWQEIIFYIQNPINIIVFIALIFSVFFSIFSDNIDIEKEYDNSIFTTSEK